MRRIVIAALMLAALALAPIAHGAVTVRPPVDDVGFPFWCDWGYDWDERCYRDGGVRLPVGGVDDKVWRSGLRFSLAGVPPAATVANARLEVSFDGVCVAPRLRTISCAATDYLLDAYPLASADWYYEREPEFFWTIEDQVYLDTAAGDQLLAWDLTDLVRDWLSGAIANNGVLLKLADGWEDFEVGGPYFPSMSAADPAARPRLFIAYTSPTGPAP
jgi:hypothetical protein